MIRLKPPAGKSEIIIDLTGPEGNAFQLMAYTKQLCNRLGWDSNGILEEMKKGDYEHLVQTFDLHFGDFVILERQMEFFSANILWLFFAYALGSVFTGYVFYKSGTRNGIESTIDSLIAQGFLRHKKDKDGEVEIIKWNDHTKQEG